MVFSFSEVGPSGRMHPGTEPTPISRHPGREFDTKALALASRIDEEVPGQTDTTSSAAPGTTPTTAADSART